MRDDLAPWVVFTRRLMERVRHDAGWTELLAAGLARLLPGGAGVLYGAPERRGFAPWRDIWLRAQDGADAEREAESLARGRGWTEARRRSLRDELASLASPDSIGVPRAPFWPGLYRHELLPGRASPIVDEVVFARPGQAQGFGVTSLNGVSLYELERISTVLCRDVMHLPTAENVELWIVPDRKVTRPKARRVLALFERWRGEADACADEVGRFRRVLIEEVATCPWNGERGPLLSEEERRAWRDLSGALRPPLAWNAAEEALASLRGARRDGGRSTESTDGRCGGLGWRVEVDCTEATLEGLLSFYAAVADVSESVVPLDFVHRS